MISLSLSTTGFMPWILHSVEEHYLTPPGRVRPLRDVCSQTEIRNDSLMQMLQHILTSKAMSFPEVNLMVSILEKSHYVAINLLISEYCLRAT